MITKKHTRFVPVFKIAPRGLLHPFGISKLQRILQNLLPSGNNKTSDYLIIVITNYGLHLCGVGTFEPRGSCQLLAAGQRFFSEHPDFPPPSRISQRRNYQTIIPRQADTAYSPIQDERH